MSQGLTNPTTGKTYIYKGFTPSSRISTQCSFEGHSDCSAKPQKLVEDFGFDFAKDACCLCQCHFEEVK